MNKLFALNYPTRRITERKTIAVFAASIMPFIVHTDDLPGSGAGLR